MITSYMLLKTNLYINNEYFIENYIQINSKYTTKVSNNFSEL